MIYPVLTYSRNTGDFTHDLAELHNTGLKALRLIYKGKSEEEFSERISEIQEKIIHQKLEIDILIDLPGKKPLVGNLPESLNIKAGEIYQLTSQEPDFTSHSIPTVNFFDHDNFRNLAAGDIISIADDELNLEVKEINDTAVICEALNSFKLTANRSMSVKNKPFAVEANSASDLQFVRNLKEIPKNLKLLVSFTKKADDLLKLKAIQPNADVIPKIETIINDTDLLDIINCCETLMLGRGDLSLVCEPKELFDFQQHLIRLCQEHNKKLIIGTGLLTGIGEKQSPSISEVMDYSNLRNMGVEAFLITGSNAHTHPFKTLEFMREFN